MSSSIDSISSSSSLTYFSDSLFSEDVPADASQSAPAFFASSQHVSAFISSCVFSITNSLVFLSMIHTSHHFNFLVFAPILSNVDVIAPCGQALLHFPHLMHSRLFGFSHTFISIPHDLWQAPHFMHADSSTLNL